MTENNVLIIVKSPPYTTLNGYEALMTAIGLWEHTVKILWTGDGVYSLLKTADHSQTEGFIRDLPDLDIEPYYDRKAIIERGLTDKELIERVSAVDDTQIKEIMAEAEATLVF